MTLFVEVALDGGVNVETASTALIVEVSSAPIPGPPGPPGPVGPNPPDGVEGQAVIADAAGLPYWGRFVYATDPDDSGNNASMYVQGVTQAGFEVNAGAGNRAGIAAAFSGDPDAMLLAFTADTFTANGVEFDPLAPAIHAADTTNVHGIADTAALATTSGVTAAVAAHEADTTNVHGIADTAALATTSGVTAAVAAHEADTTNVHGITDTAALATAASVAAVGVWQSYTPTVSGFTLGNGTVSGRYTQIGKTVHVRVSITLGSSSVVADLGVSMPVAAASALTFQTIGYSTALQTGVAFYGGTVYGIGTGQAQFGLYNSVSGVIAGITPTSPFAWAANDVIHMRWTYEAA